VFLGAATIAVPAFRFAGLSAILGYLVAGIAIGPSGIGYFSDPATLFGIAEIGVVMFLFVIGLELKVSELLELRRDIAWLGGFQLIPTAILIGLPLAFFGLDWKAALVVALALALSATSIALQILRERGHMQHRYGRKTFAILLFQDLSVVPILAIVPLLAAGAGSAEGGAFVSIAKGVAAVAAVVLVGRYLFNPMFKLLAKLNSHELMTVAALLVVLGSAWLMAAVGMSMALGAFLAGLLLAESNFRHELEADIEPFRGLLLGLFFMSVGMLIDLGFVGRNLGLVAAGTLALVGIKLGVCMALGWSEKGPWPGVIRSSALLTPAGEFSFVILPLAAGLGLLSGDQQKLFMAIAAFSMLLGPLVARAAERLVARLEASASAGQPVDEAYPDNARKALVIGFGRFGQVVNQVLLASGTDVTVIDNNIEMIESAAKFGFKVYFGDGQRLDVLRAAGAADAEVICVCVDSQGAAVMISEIARHNFRQAKLIVRAYDRRHAIELMRLAPDAVVRETFDAAIDFGGETLKALGYEPEEARAIRRDVMRRDEERLRLQIEGDMISGNHLTHKAPLKERITPTPLSEPEHVAKALSPQTQALLDDAAKAARQAV
ncbi:MAG: monovalent cation:proton antiporter-2 (CPA2) family protein, partial [Beijerinckiaceae bacterium]